jgi:glycosyltransferase involved in cell wall biosynthesis
MITKIIFWFSIVLIFYAYLGYPSLLIILSFFRCRRVIKGSLSPPVSFIITAYNEEQRIAKKIENTLKLNYDSEKLDIIVASDCSTDRTDDIVKSYEPNGVRLIRAPKRYGKEGTQKLAVDAASGDILIFSDVATTLMPNAVNNIVKNFYDSRVGCVSSEDRFIDPDNKISGEGAYVKYETFLRNLEMKVNTVIGLSGSFFAARKEVCQNWAFDLQSDFNTLLNSVKIGLRGVSDPESIGYYTNIANQKKEFDRKVRTVLRGITVMMRNWQLLSPSRYGLFAWQLFSHKICRWLVPFAMILAFLSNALMISYPSFYRTIFILQLIFYAAALSCFLSAFLRQSILKIPLFFVMVNLSILYAWYRYARGHRMIRWKPSER